MEGLPREVALSWELSNEKEPQEEQWQESSPQQVQKS